MQPSTTTKIAHNYYLILCGVVLAVLALGANAQLMNVQNQCIQQSLAANNCIQANVTNPENCSLCVMNFVNNTMMNGFTTMMGNNTNTMMGSNTNTMMGNNTNTMKGNNTNTMMGSNTNTMMRSSFSSMCHQMQGRACSAMGSCACSACSYEIETYMDCGINVTAQASGATCSGSSRKLQYSHGGSGMCSGAWAKDVRVATMIAIFIGLIHL
jgi:hypothetical protein